MKNLNLINDITLTGFVSVIYMTVSMVFLPFQKFILPYFVLIGVGRLLQSSLLRIRKLKPFAFTSPYEINGAWLSRSFTAIICAVLLCPIIVHVFNIGLISETFGFELPLILFGYRSVIYYTVVAGALILGIYLSNFESAYFGKPVFVYISMLAFFLLMAFVIIIHGKYIDISVFLRMICIMIVFAGSMIMHNTNTSLRFTVQKYNDNNGSFRFELLSVVMYILLFVIVLAVSFFACVLFNGILTLFGITERNTFDFISLIILFLTALFAVILLILTEKRTAVFLNSLFHSMAFVLEMFFEYLLRLFTVEKRNNIRRPYIETVRRVQDADIAEYRLKNKIARSYTDFLYDISYFKSIDDKIGFAYRTLCSLYNKHGSNIHLSDTPKEVSLKSEISAGGNSDSVRKIIEYVKFMDENCSDEEKSAMLNKLCLEVRKYF